MTFHKTSSKRKLLLWGALGAILVSSLIVAANQVASASRGRLAAFTVEYVESAVSPTAGRSINRDLYWAFRGDGAFSHGERGPRSARRTVMDLAGRREVIVSDTEAMKVTYDLSNRLTGNERRRIPPKDCAAPARPDYRFVGNETLLGYNTYVYEHEKQLPDQSREITRYWLAPDLLCFELKTISTRRSGQDEVTNVFQKVVLRVVPGEPDATLFSVPDAYLEVPPSAFEKRLLHVHSAATAGGEKADLSVANAPPRWLADLDRRDAAYEASKKR